VDRVAGCTTHLVFGVTAIKAPHIRGLVQMAGEADAVRFRGRELGRLANIGSRKGLGMFTAGPVTGFARLSFPSAFVSALHQLVRASEQGVVDIFMARLTGLRPDVLRGLCGLSAGRAENGKHGSCQKQPPSPTLNAPSGRRPRGLAHRRHGDHSRILALLRVYYGGAVGRTGPMTYVAALAEGWIRVGLRVRKRRIQVMAGGASRGHRGRGA